MLSFFLRDVLDEIWDLIESVSEGFPTYSFFFFYFLEAHSGFKHQNVAVAFLSFSKCANTRTFPFYYRLVRPSP